MRRKVDAIHLVSEQHVASRFRQRNASRECQNTRWTLRVFKEPLIRAFQNDFTRARFNSGAVKQDRQWNTSPFRGANCAEPPLHTFHFRFEKIAIVPRALKRRWNRQRLEFEQLLVIYCEWFLDFAFHMQPPLILINRRNRKMRPNIKQFSGRDEALEFFERHLQIERLVAPNDPAVAQFNVTFLHGIFAQVSTLKRGELRVIFSMAADMIHHAKRLLDRSAQKSARGQRKSLHATIEKGLKLRLERDGRGARYDDLFVARSLEKIHRLCNIGTLHFVLQFHLVSRRL